MTKLFEIESNPTVPIAGSDQTYPVRRIYCVGRNYEAHAREMGKDPERDPPFFFTKPAGAIVQDGKDVPYPPRTGNFHHEIELVVAIGKTAKNVSVDSATDYILGYAVGNDLTRRDLQLEARATGRPWDTGKAFDNSAPIGAIHLAENVGHLSKAKIEISVDGEVKQSSDINLLIWDVPEIVAELSTLFELQPGDLIYTGTPEGVGPVEVGQTMVGSIEGLGTVTNKVV